MKYKRSNKISVVLSMIAAEVPYLCAFKASVWDRYENVISYNL